jgi:hypothetical protein
MASKAAMRSGAGARSRDREVRRVRDQPIPRRPQYSLCLGAGQRVVTGRSPRLLTSCGLIVAAAWTRSAALATRAASSRVSRAVILKLTSLGECGAYCGIVALRGETFLPVVGF